MATEIINVPCGAGRLLTDAPPVWREERAELATEIERLTDRLLSDVAAEKPLAAEEEAELARLVSEGKEAFRRLDEPGIPAGERRRLEEVAGRGREALGTLVAHNLPLVVRMTRRYRWSGVPDSYNVAFSDEIGHFEYCADVNADGTCAGDPGDPDAGRPVGRPWYGRWRHQVVHRGDR
jgi:hypothetical protein